MPTIWRDPHPVTSRGAVLDDRGRWRLARDAAGYVSRGEVLFKALDLGGPGQAAIEPQTQWTAPMRWEKHPANPIFGPQTPGRPGWDTWTNGVSIVPMTDGAGCRGFRGYRMYFAGTKGEGIGFAEASVDDPVTWREHPANPVLRPRTDNWEGTMINQPRVVQVTDAHWRMYYTGWGFDGPGTKWALGLAESFDGGTTWQRHGQQPILPRGPIDSPDGAGACVPTILWVKDRWMMWYTAGQMNADGHQNIHICLATSADGLNWEKHQGNPVLTDDFADGAARSVTSRCSVRRDAGVYRMWYSFAKPDYRIHYAESLDGIDWERSPVAPVLGPSPAPSWDDTMVEYPEVQLHNGEWRLWFCGNGYGSVGFARGVVRTGVRFAVRTGDSAERAAAAAWQDAEPGAAIDAWRFVQVRAELWSHDPDFSPALNRVRIQANG